ncbi:zinc ribbon-containing protein [Rheinheimera tilapiae]|uniref:Zinc ribbon-containing protein n=1 Tax=Rheinheimera tilapiae TaxID=875043 RepID=A0ABV6BBF4_9GAMM
MTDLMHKYRHWLQQLDQLLHSAQAESDPLLRPAHHVADTFSAYIKAGRDLTAYETQLFIETFFHQQQLPQPPSIWPETLWQLLAQVTDKTQVEWQELEQDLSHQGLYLQGEPVGMGLYLCRNCGETMHYNHPATLIPCPGCGGGHFLRRGLPV